MQEQRKLVTEGPKPSSASTDATGKRAAMAFPFTFYIPIYFLTSPERGQGLGTHSAPPNRHHVLPRCETALGITAWKIFT